jgi:hypothetical protein
MFNINDLQIKNDPHVNRCLATAWPLLPAAAGLVHFLPGARPLFSRHCLATFQRLLGYCRTVPVRHRMTSSGGRCRLGKGAQDWKQAWGFPWRILLPSRPVLFTRLSWWIPPTLSLTKFAHNVFIDAAHFGNSSIRLIREMLEGELRAMPLLGISPSQAVRLFCTNTPS